MNAHTPISPADLSTDWRSRLVPYTPTATPAREAFHRTGETFFDPLGVTLVKRGWSVFPQTRDERRGPGLVDGRGLKWKEFATRLPTLEEVRWWAINCPTHNVAAIMGSASGHAITLDIDIGDEWLSAAVQRLADEMLGATEFRRVGRAPRIALIYREDVAAGGPRIASRSWRFAAEDGGKGDDGIEILGPGKPITVYGNHHKTGQYFQWTGKQPTIYGPEHAPAITQAQVQAFLDAVQELRAFHRPTSSGIVEAFVVDTKRPVDSSERLTPPPGLKHSDRHFGVGEKGGEVEWSKVDSGWKVTRYRDQFLFRRSYDWVVAYRHLVLQGEKGLAMVRRAAGQEALEWIARSGEWGTDEAILRQVQEKVDRTASRLRDGTLHLRAVYEDAQGRRHAVRSTTIAVTKPTDPFGFILSHIKPAEHRKGIRDVIDEGTPDEAKAFERRIRDEIERAAIRTEVSRKVRRVIKSWLYRIWAAVRAQKEDKLIALLKAPPGAGKSTTLIKLIAEVVSELGPLGRPIGIMMPAHVNLDEMHERAMQGGGISAWDLRGEDDLVALGRDRGIVVMVYRGRLRAGCQRPEEMALAEQAGLSGGNLCVEQNPKDGEEPETCIHFQGCPAIAQRLKIALSDVVLMATAYLHAQPPAELTKGLTALVIDERCWDSLVHSTAEDPLPLSVLRTRRNPPEIAKKRQEKEGLVPEDLAIERNLLAAYVADAIQRGERPERAVRRMPRIGPNARGAAPFAEIRSYIEAALLVTAPSWERSKEITPRTTLLGLQHLASFARVAYLAHEHRFWKLLLERLEAEEHDTKTAPGRSLVERAVREGKMTPEKGAKKLLELGAERRAFGSWDRRFQRVRNAQGTVCVRTSWRTKPNFGDLPILMLDASAEPLLISKVWRGRKVRAFTVDAPLHIRTVAMIDSTQSDRSMTASKKRRSAKEDATVAANVSLHRDLITTVCALYDHQDNDNSGEVLAGVPKKSRPILQAAWTPPRNLSTAHFGALRGLNAYERCSAAISIGRIEPPVSAIDGIVAALTYDDDEPEDPIDVHGNGRTAWEGGEDLVPQQGERTIMLRNGADMKIVDSMYSGRWAAIVQRQSREEELLQFVGRLRGVYRRGEPPVWFLAARCVPEGIVVDEVCSVSDVARSTGKGKGQSRVFEIGRRNGGVIDALVGAPHTDIHGGALYQPEKIAELDLDNPDSRAAKGKIRIDYLADGDTEWRHTWTLGSTRDPVAEVTERMALVGVMVVEARLHEAAPPRVEATRKAPDAIDREVAGLDESMTMDDYDIAMEAIEERLRARVRGEVIREMGGEPNSWMTVGVPGVQRKDLRVSLDERMIWTILREMSEDDEEEAQAA